MANITINNVPNASVPDIKEGARLRALSLGLPPQGAAGAETDADFVGRVTRLDYFKQLANDARRAAHMAAMPPPATNADVGG